MSVREIRATDQREWLRMRTALWPGCPVEQHEAEMKDIQQTPGRCAVGVFDRGQGVLGGFIEVAVREHVDGATTSPVAYVEGWYVDEDLRRQGEGRLLLAYAEEWAGLQGLTEIASDAEVSNQDSISVHLACEFQETARVVQFVKRLRS